MPQSSVRTERFILILFSTVVCLLILLLGRLYLHPPADLSPFKYGYINQRGSLEIPFDYDSAGDFRGLYATVKKEGRLFVIDTNGNPVSRTPFSYCIDSLPNKHLLTAANPAQFQELHKPYAVLGEPSQGFFLVRIQRMHHLNPDGSALFDFVYTFIPQHGQTHLPIFEEASPFHEGMALVKTQKTKQGTDRPLQHGYGYIDKEGQFLIRPVYPVAHSFSSGRALVGLPVNFHH